MGYDTMSAWDRIQMFEFNDEIQKRGGVWDKQYSFTEGPGRSISHDDYIPPEGTPPLELGSMLQGAILSRSPSQSPTIMSVEESFPSYTPPLSLCDHPVRMASDRSPVVSPQTWQERSKLAEGLYRAACTGDLQEIKSLLEQGAPINEGTVVKGLYDSFKPPKAGKLSPLAGAAGNGHLDVVELLVLCGAEINPQVNLSSSSPLHQACRNSDGEMVTLLLDLGADVNLNNAYMTTPLMYAARHGSVEVLEMILEFKPDLDSVSFIKSAAIHWAVWTGKADVVEALLKVGARPNHEMGDGTTPLHCAASGDQLEVARVLLKYGADPSRRDEHYQTPIQLAEEAGHHNVMALLEAAALKR